MATIALTLVVSLTTAIAATPSAVTSAVASASVIAPATSAAGPMKTATAEYRLKPSIDPDVLEDFATEIWARVYWPEPGSATAKNKKHPLLVFLHGNHGTCGRGTNPRDDVSCEYTNEGTCPSGFVVTPNHEGYNYTAENLASWGYVVVSINANRGITCGGGGSDDWGLILARGRLVLKHLQLWNEWSNSGGAPASLGDPKQFLNRIDIANVGLMGHSRGGEGVRAALNLYRDPGSVWKTRIPNLDIKAIYEIGAVDGQSDRVLDAPSVAWTQLLPLCDGDVSDLQGRMPFERMMSRFNLKSEAESRPTPKSLLMVWGANHNYFNTEWQTSDAYSCQGEPTHAPIFDGDKIESPQQKAIALQTMNAFFRAHVGEEALPELGRTFDPAFGLPAQLSSVGQIDRDFVPGFELPKFLRIDDFTSKTGTSSSGVKNKSSDVDVTHDQNSEPPVANMYWKSAKANTYHQMNMSDLGKGSDVSTFDFLDFRVGRSFSDAEKNLKSPVEFSVQLVQSDDSLSKLVEVANFATLTGPPESGAELTQTVRVPLSAFGPTDLKAIRGVRFVFNKTPKGTIRAAHVRFGVEAHKVTTFGSKTFAQIQDINNAVAVLMGESLNTMDSKPAETTPPELILPPGSPHLSTPFSLTGRTHQPPSRRASWMKPRKIRQSSYLKGASSVELSASTADLFPVTNALPILNIEGRLFPIARFPSNGKTHTLIFSIPLEQYEQLPAHGRAQIQYGKNSPRLVWELTDFWKAETDSQIAD